MEKEIELTTTKGKIEEETVFKESEDEGESRRVKMSAEVRRRIDRRGTIERVLQLRKNNGLDTIKEKDEEHFKIDSTNDLKVENNENTNKDKITFLSSKEEPKSEKEKVKEVFEIKEPIPVKVGVKMFMKKEIKDDIVSDNSDSEEEKQPDPEPEEKKEVQELGPGEFTEEELNKGKDEESQIKVENNEEEKEIKSPEPIKKKLIKILLLNPQGNGTVSQL